MNPALNASSVLQCFKHGRKRSIIMFDFYPGLPHLGPLTPVHLITTIPFPLMNPVIMLHQYKVLVSIHQILPSTLSSRSTWAFPCISIGNKAHLFWKNLWIFMLVQCPHLVYTSQGLCLISGHSPVSETPVLMYTFITHHHKYQNLESGRPGNKARAEWLMSKSQRLLLNSPGLERFPVTSPYEIFIIHRMPY